MIDPIEFRRAMGHFATGVTIVTTLDGQRRPCGLTANAFCSVSLEPMLVLVCIDVTSDTHQCIRDAGCFAVNALQEGSGEVLSRRFSTYGIEDKFQGVAYRAESSGAPVLEESLMWLDCRVTNEVPAGDHTVFFGEVLAADAREGTPLVYYRGGYGRFVP
jgi:flavin reductase (DIM6/NTAB) family NADH-FMN oxidoreductase RutF